MTITAANLTDVDWSRLPRPLDDGGARHLPGVPLPAMALPATLGDPVDLSALDGRTVLYVYPMTGRPGLALPEGWDEIPGARGCTPQSCAFRDHYSHLRAAGADRVFGLSTQVTEDQREAAERLHLPFPLLSDARLEFAKALRLPQMAVDGRTMLRRLSMVIDDGRVAHVFYPVFPPDQNAGEVLSWLEKNPK